MISINRPGVLGRRLWSASLIGAMLTLAAAAPSVAQQTQPAIDAQQDPDAAAAAIQAGGSASNIRWQTGTDAGGCAGSQPAPASPVQQAPCVPAQNNTRHYTITNGLGPPAVFGDVLYNCSPSAGAESDTGTSDARTESWTLSEKVSLKISAGLPDIVSASAEVSAFSSQSNAADTTVTDISGVGVPAGWKGWTTTQVSTTTVSGTAYVTDSVRNTVTPLQNIDWSFPGYANNALNTKGKWTMHSYAMTAKEVDTICNSDPVDPALLRSRVVGAGFTVRKPSKIALRVCGPAGRCKARTVTGTLPPSRIRRAEARLTRAGHTYGRGTYIPGHTRVDMKRPLPPGTYRLTLREPSQRVAGQPLHTIETILRVTVS